MKSFLLKDKSPIIKWGMLPDGIHFEGNIPEGYDLAVCPSKEYVIIDVDRHGTINGFDNVPENFHDEMLNTLNYKTRNDGCHYWFRYSGDAVLANKTSGLGIDLRTNKGYVVWYPKEDVRDCIDRIKDSSPMMNEWLETLFSYKHKNKKS